MSVVERVAALLEDALAGADLTPQQRTEILDRVERCMQTGEGYEDLLKRGFLVDNFTDEQLAQFRNTMLGRDRS